MKTSEHKLTLCLKIQSINKSNEVLINENQKLKAENEELKNQNQLLQNSEMELKTINEKLEIDIEKSLKDQKICGDLKTLIQSDEVLRDFNIKIDDQQFPAHRIFLAARSPTLAEILLNNPEADSINLVDISVDIFKDILNFLYTDEFPDAADFVKLFAAAGRLKIDELKNFAGEKILELFDDFNALEILCLANKYGHDEMRRRAFEEIKKMYPKIDFKDEWSMDIKKIEKAIDSFAKLERELRSLDLVD
jgi:hypothetical protein